MALNLQPAVHVHKNEQYKSAGENHVVMHAEGQMTDTKLIFHATGEQTNGAVLVTEIVWNPGDASLHHLHKLEDEGFYVIEGQLTLHTPGGDVHLSPGEFGWGPRNVRHAYTVGPEGARVLLIQTPGTQLSDFFKKASNVGDLQGEGEFEQLAQWSEHNYGVVFFDPTELPPGQSITHDDHVSTTR
jgi:quercetin dioxygenase-like cupin family protein